MLKKISNMLTVLFLITKMLKVYIKIDKKNDKFTSKG